MGAAASEPVTARPEPVTTLPPVTELLTNLKTEAFLGVDAVESPIHNRGFTCCHACTDTRHGQAVLAACQHRDRTQQLLDDYQRTGDVLAVYRALLECRSQAEGAAYTPGPDEEACARLANVAIVKRYRDALAKLEPFTPQPLPVPGLSTTQPPTATLQLVFAWTRGEEHSGFSDHHETDRAQQTLTLKEGIECGRQLPPEFEAKALAAAQTVIEASVGKAMTKANASNTISFIAAHNTSSATQRDLIIPQPRLSKNVFYYQIRVQVPLTGGAPPLIVYGGYITSNRQIAL